MDAVKKICSKAGTPRNFQVIIRSLHLSAFLLKSVYHNLFLMCYANHKMRFSMALSTYLCISDLVSSSYNYVLRVI